ncbi:MAG: penicillin acylase family protein [Verrucomicrobia bacterium]|nr:penicillin acylase family protein [Verrucomicrobiota bacterium]
MKAAFCRLLPRVLRFALIVIAALSTSATAGQTNGAVEILRDQWGVPHVFAKREADGFFGVGYACAEDRRLQMELLRRRTHGQLAEVFGEKWVESDRKFRLAGMTRYCAEAVASLPADLRANLAAFAAGVNAFVAEHPEQIKTRFAPLGVEPEPWTPADCLAAWLGVAEVFDHLYDESAVRAYHEFQQLAREPNEAQARQQRTLVIDDFAAVVSEAEMAKDRAAYARLKAMKRVRSLLPRSLPDESIKLSHAWAVDGTRSTTGKPILESDPQTSVNNPALWYEFHLAAGRYDVRGVGVAGCPALLIGWNRRVAWGATALGIGSTVTFLEKLSPDGRGYLLNGETRAFARRLERIAVKEGPPVIQEVLSTPHGFVFNSLLRQPNPNEACVSFFKQAHDRATSVRAMLEWMRARHWKEFQSAMEHYYSPGLHVVYADAAGNIAYQTLVHRPVARSSTRLALEGWTGADEVLGRIPLRELPHMLNPEAHFISHANNLPVGSWYPHELGLGTGGIGDTTRSMRLRQLLSGGRKLSVEDFERVVHRDDVNAAVAALWPVARRVALEEKVSEPAVQTLIESLKGWDLHYRSAESAYASAMALADNLVLSYRMSGLRDRLGGGEGGICHLARLLGERFGSGDATPTDPQVRGYLLDWLKAAAGVGGRGGGRAGARARPGLIAQHAMPYQANGPLGFPSLDSALDLRSPPLSCTQGGTIWSQAGNSFSQIVDLANVDNSRSVLPPGLSEDAASPFHTNQVPLWVAGATHPAPLSRKRVEAITVQRRTLRTIAYAGPAAPRERLAAEDREAGARFIPAIPATGPTSRDSRASEPLPGRKPDDAQLEAALRYLIRPERVASELDAKVNELRDYVKVDRNLRAQLASGLKLILHLKYGTAEAQQRMGDLLRELEAAEKSVK